MALVARVGSGSPAMVRGPPAQARAGPSGRAPSRHRWTHFCGAHRPSQLSPLCALKGKPTPEVYLEWGHCHLAVYSRRGAVLLKRVSSPGTIQVGFGWPFVRKLIITQNLASNRPDLFKGHRVKPSIFNSHSGVCWKCATEFRLELKVTGIYHCFPRTFNPRGLLFFHLRYLKKILWKLWPFCLRNLFYLVRLWNPEIFLT